MLIIPHSVRRWFTDPRMLRELRVFSLSLTAAMGFLGVCGYALHQKLTESPEALISVDSVKPRYQVSVR